MRNIRHFDLPDMVEIKVEWEGDKMQAWAREPGTEDWYEMEPKVK